MKNIKSRLTSGLVATVLLTAGFATVGQAATTQDSAEAYTISQCWRYNTNYEYCYVDYNWYEESWWGGSHRDGRQLIFRPLIYKTW